MFTEETLLRVLHSDKNESKYRKEGAWKGEADEMKKETEMKI